jgi:NAD(P)-dependent dehydrogenase (short-subunit alcohol dehydrogenase family)
MGVLGGKVVIVTGGTSGIGACMAETFAAEGAKVVVAGRRREEGEAIAKRLGAGAEFIQADVTREDDVTAMIGRTVKMFGRLDCLVNNAGRSAAFTGIADIDVDDFEGILRVHVLGVALGMKHAAPVMAGQKSGSIINVASVAGSAAGWSAHTYSAAKAAIIHLTRCVALELGEQGVRVNTLSPGAIPTGIFAKVGGVSDSIADRTLDVLKASFSKVQPIPRAGTVEDIAAAAVYLASDVSSFVSGQNLTVDGAGSAGSRSWSAAQAMRAELAKQMSALKA